MTIEERAKQFHDAYERLAPQFGYEARPDTKVFDPASPNGKLMIAVVGEALPVVVREFVKRVSDAYAADRYNTTLFQDKTGEAFASMFPGESIDRAADRREVMDDNNLTAIIETPVRYDKETAWVRDAQEEFICEVDTKRVGKHIATCINEVETLTAQVAELKGEVERLQRYIAELGGVP
jgi:hypothetical protein